MRLAATLRGDLREHLRADRQAGARAVRAALGEGARGIVLDLRRQVLGAGLSRRLANTIRDRVYPARPSLAAAGLVFNRAPHILEPLAQGATIRARRGRYLAIPTGYNREGGRGGGRVRMTPRQMASQPGRTFVLPTRDGVGLVWCLRVARGTRLTGTRGREAAYAGGELLVGGRSVRRTREILEAGHVPMFVLLPAVTLGRRLDPGRTIEDWGRRVPQLLLHLWTREAARS